MIEFETLILSLLVLPAGALFYIVFKNKARVLDFIDGFSFISITGLLLFSFVPHLVQKGGAIMIAVVIASVFLPTIIELSFKVFREQAHYFSLVIGIGGLVFHDALDGIMLNHGLSAHKDLPLAIIIHRLPVGLVVWRLLEKYGKVVQISVLMAMTLATTAGYYLGEQATGFAQGMTATVLEAIVVGSLLHVIIHRLGHRSRENHRAEGLGGTFGGILLIIVLMRNTFFYEIDSENHIWQSFLSVTISTSPAILLGYLFAGIMNHLRPETYFRWMRHRSSLVQSLRGMIIGLPVPVCSCGVIPVYKTLVEKGTPISASIAFLIATPELGIDAVLLSIPLLGGKMTLVRIGAAALVALLIGWAMKAVSGKSTPGDENPEYTPETKSRETIKVRVKKMAYFGFVEVLDHTAPWIIVGIFVAAVTSTFVNLESFASLSPLAGVIFFALAGLPLYVCASGATPLVAVLLIKGVSPGAAMAFLLTGPATNIATFGLLKSMHGKKTAIFFSLLIITVSILIGYSIDSFILPGFNAADSSVLNHGPGLIENISVVILALLLFYSFLRRGARNFFKELVSPFSNHSHEH